MKKIKIAQIGTSETEHAVQVFKSLRAHPEVFEVRGFADVDRHTRPLSAFFDPSLQR